MVRASNCLRACNSDDHAHMGAPAGVYGVPLARLPLGWDRNFAVPLLNCDAGSQLQGLGVSVGFFFCGLAELTPTALVADFLMH